ncbi:MAG: ABC transporter permease [Dehalococcoidia bacterium]
MRYSSQVEEALALAEERYRAHWVGWWRGLRRFVVRKPLGAIGGFIVLGLLVLAIFAPLIAPYAYDKTNIDNALAAPSDSHFFGTDDLGRDVFSRIVYGSRITVFVGFGAVAISTFIATSLGVLSGYVGGRLDMLVQRVVDIWMSFPGLILLITIISIFEPGLIQVIVAIGILLAGGPSRVARSAVLAIKNNQYMEAAKVVGAGDVRIVRFYVLPNIFAPIMVLATTQLGFAILIEATLSFLGYGVPPPFPSWGGMLSNEARTYMLQQPLLSVWPGLAIFLVVYGFNMLGDAVRDVFDPRLRGAT